MAIPLSSQFDLQAQLPLRKYDVVADNTARDAIPASTRYIGRIVYSLGANTNYQLQGGITNADRVATSGSQADRTATSGPSQISHLYVTQTTSANISNVVAASSTDVNRVTINNGANDIKTLTGFNTLPYDYITIAPTVGVTVNIIGYPADVTSNIRLAGDAVSVTVDGTLRQYVTLRRDPIDGTYVQVYGLGASGIAIGQAVVGGTAPAIPFIGVGNVIAQDPTNFFYNPVAQTAHIGFGGFGALHIDQTAGSYTIGDLDGILGGNGTIFAVDDPNSRFVFNKDIVQLIGKTGLNGASLLDIDGEIFDLALNVVKTVTSATTNVAGVGNYVEFDPVADTPYGGTGIYTKFEVPSTNSKIFDGALPGVNAAGFQSAATYLMVYAGTSTTNANYAFSGVGFSLGNDNSGNIPYGIGISGTVYNNQDGYIALAGGSNIEISNTSGSVVGIIDIGYGYVANFNNTIGIINSGIGYVTRYTNDGTGTIGDVKHMWMMTPINSGGGVYNNIYGLYIDDQSGIATGDGFNIFSRGVASENVFEGFIQVGTLAGVGTRVVTADPNGVLGVTSFPVGGATLLATHVGFGNGSDLLTGSASLTYAANVFQNVANNAGSVSAAFFVGAGINDMTSGGNGAYTGTTGHLYRIKIDSVTETFERFKDGVSQAANVAITGGVQALDSGVTITFGAGPHTLNDYWLIQASLVGTIKTGDLYLNGAFFASRVPGKIFSGQSDSIYIGTAPALSPNTNNNTIVGPNITMASIASNNTALGSGIILSGVISNSTAIGSQITITDSNCIVIGQGAGNTLPNQFAMQNSIVNWYIRGLNYVMPSVQPSTITAMVNSGTPGVLTWGKTVTERGAITQYNLGQDNGGVDQFFASQRSGTQTSPAGNNNLIIGNPVYTGTTNGDNVVIGVGAAGAGGNGTTIFTQRNTFSGSYAGHEVGLVAGSWNYNTGFGNGAIAGHPGNTGFVYNTGLGAGAFGDIFSNSSKNSGFGMQVGGFAQSSFNENTLGGCFAGFNLHSGLANVYFGSQDPGGAMGGWKVNGNASYLTGLGAGIDFGIGTGTTEYPAANYDSSIAIGYKARINAAHQGVIGGNDANGYIDHLYLGNGVQFATPTGITIHATGGMGTNNAGANLINAAGQGTGTAVGGDWLVQTALAGSTGSSLNALGTRIRVSGTTGAVKFNEAYVFPTADAASNGMALTRTSAGVLTFANPTAGAMALSALTAATAINTIDSLGYRQNRDWNGITNDVGLAMRYTGGTATTMINNGGMWGIIMNGTVAASATTFGAQIINANTGTSNTNIGLSITASGGTNNYALLTIGRIGFNVTGPTALVHIGAGTTSLAPLKFTTGTNLSTAEASSMEYNGSFYMTKANGLRFGVGGAIFAHFANVGNVGGGEDDLYTDTLPGNTLALEGESIEAFYALTTVGSATETSQIKIYFGGTVIYDSGSLGINTNADFNYKVDIVEETNTIVRCTVTASTTSATAAPYTVYTRITGLTLSNPQVIKITGTRAGVTPGNDEIVARVAKAKWMPAPYL